MSINKSDLRTVQELLDWCRLRFAGAFDTEAANYIHRILKGKGTPVPPEDRSLPTASAARLEIDELREKCTSQAAEIYHLREQLNGVRR